MDLLGIHLDPFLGHDDGLLSFHEQGVLDNAHDPAGARLFEIFYHPVGAFHFLAQSIHYGVTEFRHPPDPLYSAVQGLPEE